MDDNNALVPIKIKDRIKELRRVPANSLLSHPDNWRVHPENQSNALQGLFDQIGIADAVLAYENDDKELMLIDGHLRTDLLGEEMIAVLITYLNEDEAKLILATHDPITELASQNDETLKRLLDNIEDSENVNLQRLLDDLKESAYEWNPNVFEVENTEPANIGLFGTITIKAPQNIIPDIREKLEDTLKEYDELTIV